VAYATWQDVEARWPGKTFTSDEQALATALLDDAAVELDGLRLPSDPPTAHELNVRRVVSCGMVKRAMGGPVAGFGVASQQQGAGPYQETTQFANPLGDLYLTAAEKRLVLGRPKAWSVDLLATPGDDEDEESP